jgi:maltooligosyltrehalose trehalohydrolase
MTEPRLNETPYAVWAPEPGTVELQLGARRLPMVADGGGWWRSDEPAADEPYGYVLDGEGPFPDPASRRQPDGVHALSALDREAFAWSDGDWHGRPLAGGVIYELHLGTFTPEGTLDAAIAKLPHLRSIGVDFVEMLPVNGFNGTHNWGYDGVLWYTVHEGYGGPAAYRRFVDAAHAAGLGVIQDVVYNHLGPSGNHLPKFGPYLHSLSSNTWGDSLNLDGDGSDEVRRFVLENVRQWLRDFHVDGLRLDAVHALVDHRATHILAEIADEVAVLEAQLGRPLSLIAESDLNDPRMITPRSSGGLGMDGQWSDDFHHAVHVALTGETQGYYADFEPLSALAKVLERGFFHDGTLSTFRGRHHGAPIDRASIPGWRLVVANQNHDQVGNRAAGDRLPASLDDGSLAIAAALTLLGPFTPMLFMGEEWAAATPWPFFTSHPEEDLGEATREGRIAEFERMGWDESQIADPQDPATFTGAKLDWTEQEAGRGARILAWYRELARLRRELPEITDPRLERTRVELDEAARSLVLHRGAVRIAFNLGDSSARLVASGELLAEFGGAALDGAELALPARSVAVLR